MTGATGAYTQCFDTLASSGSAGWTNDLTLPGWQAFRNSSVAVTGYTASAGADTAGKFYSFGASTSSERALGLIGSGATEKFYWGVVLRNNSDETVTNLLVQYAGEQWRNANTAAQSIVFESLVSAVLPAVNDRDAVGEPALDFTSPVCGSDAGALDGNLPANRAARSGSLDARVPPGHYLMLRWYDINHNDDDHGLAIDDLRVDWRMSEPLPAAYDPGVGVSHQGMRENFDSLGSAAAAILPAGWRVDKHAHSRTVVSYAAATNSTEMLAGNNIPSSGAANGIYNFGAGDKTSASDRSVGGLSSGDASKSVNVYVKLRNDTDLTVTRWRVRYSVEKYRRGSNPAGFRLQLLAGANGRDWTAVTPAATLFPADASNEGYPTAPGLSVSEECIVCQTVPPGGLFYLAWNYSVAAGDTSSNAQALGLDDVQVKPWQTATVFMLR